MDLCSLPAGVDARICPNFTQRSDLIIQAISPLFFAVCPLSTIMTMHYIFQICWISFILGDLCSKPTKPLVPCLSNKSPRIFWSQHSNSIMLMSDEWLWRQQYLKQWKMAQPVTTSASEMVLAREWQIFVGSQYSARWRLPGMNIMKKKMVRGLCNALIYFTGNFGVQCLLVHIFRWVGYVSLVSRTASQILLDHAGSYLVVCICPVLHYICPTLS